jgi:hypothetical protein
VFRNLFRGGRMNVTEESFAKIDQFKCQCLPLKFSNKEWKHFLKSSFCRPFFVERERDTSNYKYRIYVDSCAWHFKIAQQPTVSFRDLQCVQGFSRAKSANSGSILSSSQFLILPQLPQKIKLTSKVVKIDSKIIISLSEI